MFKDEEGISQNLFLRHYHSIFMGELREIREILQSELTENAKCLIPVSDVLYEAFSLITDHIHYSVRYK